MQNNKHYQNEAAVNDGSTAYTIISWLFGLLFLFIGFVNTFWGNDPFFGIFIILLSFMYFLPVNDIINKLLGFRIPRLRLIKILTGIFIIWAALGVGELFDKIELMLHAF